MLFVYGLPRYLAAIGVLPRRRSFRRIGAGFVKVYNMLPFVRVFDGGAQVFSLFLISDFLVDTKGRRAVRKVRR